MDLDKTSEEIELRKNEADRNILWERYKFWSSEIVQYFRLVMQFTIWFYAITGAIMTFVLNKPSPGILQIVFLLPGLMGIMSGCAYIYFVWRLRFTNEELDRLAAKLFTYTNNDLKIIRYIANKAEYQPKAPKDRFLAAMREAKQKYNIDGTYCSNTAHHLQATLAILGLTHILVGTFCIYLYCGITISLFTFASALLASVAFCWRSEIDYNNSLKSSSFSEENISVN